MANKKKAQKQKKPKAIKWTLGRWTITGLLLYFILNFAWQVLRKPSELLSILGADQARMPHQLWRDYGEGFVKYQTDLVSASLLAAMAQVESSGNPVATPVWKWNFQGGVFDLYTPSSSSVGLFQFTDGTFAEAKRYCVVNGEVLEDGPWHKFRSCWFNQLYTRTWPSHAIEMTSAYLHKKLQEFSRAWSQDLNPERARLRLASVIHLCGAGRGRLFANSGLRLESLGLCGSHNARRYVQRVERLESVFRGWATHLLNRGSR